MMTTAAIAARSTEFVRENFTDNEIAGRTEIWENGAITVSHTVGLPVANLQAVIKVSASGKTVSIAMTLCADAMLNTTSLNDQIEMRPEEFDSYMNYHLSALMNLADEYLERVANGAYDVDLALALIPEDILNPPF